MRHRGTAIPGDGIGPEVTGATTAVIAAADVAIHGERVEVGEAAAAARIETAVTRVIGVGKRLTRDPGGPSDTRTFAEAVIEALA
jgi:isocitrate dehydrogenase (NAD+)